MKEYLAVGMLRDELLTAYPKAKIQMYGLKKTGCNQTQVAEIVSVDKSTISRELRRNKGQKAQRAGNNLKSRGGLKITAASLCKPIV